MTSARLLSTKLFVPPYISVVATPRHRSFTGNAVLRHNDDHRASSKLFEDAAREEAEEAAAPPRPSKVTMLEGENENWTGEESVKDAVLRMLVDKYKPLRSGPIRTADEKLKQAPPKVSPPGGGPDFVTSPPSAETSTEAVTPRRYLPNEPLLPSIEGHRPWHTTFKVPSHATSNVRYGHIPNPVRRGAPLSVDEKAKRKERDMKRRTEQAGRLSRARESTLDYRLGIKNGADAMHKRPNPASMKGWASLVEDKIEVHYSLISCGIPLAYHLIACPSGRTVQEYQRPRSAIGIHVAREESIHWERGVSHESHCPAAGRSSAVDRSAGR